jgi:hypothetical protein
VTEATQQSTAVNQYVQPAVFSVYLVTTDNLIRARLHSLLIIWWLLSADDICQQHRQ